MRHLITGARAFLRDDSGQDLMEYGLLSSLIAVFVLAAVGDVGSHLSDLWMAIVDQLDALL